MTSTFGPDWAFSFRNDRSVVALGHLADDEMLKIARRLFAQTGNNLDPDASSIVRRWALIEKEADGSETIMWNIDGTGERVTALTPGAQPVTLVDM